MLSRAPASASRKEKVKNMSALQDRERALSNSGCIFTDNVDKTFAQFCSQKN